MTMITIIIMRSIVIIITRRPQKLSGGESQTSCKPERTFHISPLNAQLSTIVHKTNVMMKMIEILMLKNLHRVGCKAVKVSHTQHIELATSETSSIKVEIIINVANIMIVNILVSKFLANLSNLMPAMEIWPKLLANTENSCRG